MKILLISSNVFVICCLLCYAYGEKKVIRDNYNYWFNHNFGRETSSNYQNGGVDDAISKMTTALLHDIHRESGSRLNIILSPVSIWTILAMLWEGAAGKTENQLKTKLNVQYRSRGEGRHIIRSQYERLKNIFEGRNSSTEFTSLNFFISDKMKNLSPEYRNLIGRHYDGLLFTVDKDKVKYAKIINRWASVATGNRIRSIVTPGVLNNLVLTIGNAIFLKSKWKNPFDPTLTISMPFKDENANFVNQIPMMNQILNLPYKFNEELESQIVEIPYSDGITSMIVILPEDRVKLENVLSKMRKYSLKEIVGENMRPETIHLSLPRFHVVSELNLNEALKHDLASLFSPREAEFPFMGNNVFVSRIAHKAEIENTEEGTTSSAISSVDFAYKSSPLVFRANRPFIYFINEIKTRMPLFGGIYSNPISGF